MPPVRNNHYVPRWHQAGFIEPGGSTLAYRDLAPDRRTLADGRVIIENDRFNNPTKRCFRQRDLYSTFFGAEINDEIERMLFGRVDTDGSAAVRALSGLDVNAWITHFQTFFQYVDLQKLRTPKGLDALRAQYPAMSQNELMLEMQGLRAMHCTIWSEGVREIVSAEDSDIKFILSDHPVTVYNPAAEPKSTLCAYPADPSIALKGSQTLFPLDRNHCLILTNLEGARDPAASPLEKRTFARHYRNSMVRADAFIRSRTLTRAEVSRINRIIKVRARRYIAAGQAEWLDPEAVSTEPWADLRDTLRPPEDGLWHFGGEMFARFEDGRVHRQDEFGRTEKPRDFLLKAAEHWPNDGAAPCGCGSGRAFQTCCLSRPETSRPSWAERSIRERNLMLYDALTDVLGIDAGKDWTQVRRDMTDNQIATVYTLFEALWPLETDLLSLLPKPDGRPRAVFTGFIHPEMIPDFALGSPLYFGEVLIEHPFAHPGVLREAYNPVANPRAFRQEVLKTLGVFFALMPLVEIGAVNLVPDPCIFDPHLREQMMHMAQRRAASLDIEMQADPRIQTLRYRDAQRTLYMLPTAALEAQIRKATPQLGPADVMDVVEGMEQLKLSDPLAVLQPDSLGGEDGGQLQIMKLAPNFELSMYLAKATGAAIITDSPYRWRELRQAAGAHHPAGGLALAGLVEAIGQAAFIFPQVEADVADMVESGVCEGYPALIRDAFNYLANPAPRGRKPNWEAHLAARFKRLHAGAQRTMKSRPLPSNSVRLSLLCPPDGIRDNTVNRLLLMSSSERHLPSVPFALFLQGM